jgi:hypothetical protein
MRIAVTAAAFGVTLLATSLAAHAGSAHAAFTPGAEPRLAGPRTTALGTRQTLNGTVIDYGDLGTTFGTGYTLVDQSSIKCTKACTIVIDANEQVGDAGVAGNWFGVCPQVDGNFSEYGCPYAGEVPSDYSFIYARARQTFAVAKGTHTVQVYLYLSSASADSLSFDIQYQVYTP